MWRVAIIYLTALITFALFGAGAALSQVPKNKDLDKQHDDIVKDFVTRTHKLALQYQQAGQYGKAKDTLDLILKVSPDNPEAKALLDKMHKQELSENKKVVKIMANQGWQKTGVQVLEGKPVVIEAKGDWVFTMRRSTGADGLEMPDDMKKFPLGSLIGAIDAEDAAPAAAPQKKGGKADNDPRRPFLVGAQKTFDRAPATGMLYLKIHDTDESDNQGQLMVTISGQVRER
jgi:hypothetical protein